MIFKLIFFSTFIFCHLIWAENCNIVCFYDASSADRNGIGQFTLTDLENSLEFCTHIIYGYTGINSLTFQINSLELERDMGRKHFKEVTSLKAKYPHIKFLLSLGGGKGVDYSVSNKYLQLLETDQETHNTFIQSVVYLLRSNKFDGLDLAFQFPSYKNNTKPILNAPWKSLRKLFTKKLNETAYIEKDHKSLFSVLVENLRTAFKPHDLMLTLTILSNINNCLYFNASALIKNLDFINLQTFDFITPEISPQEASYTAPLYALPLQGGSNAEQTIDYQVNYWISQRVPPNKINVGIAAYGRAWSLTTKSNKYGFPKVLAANGPAPASYITNLPGIMTWTEICPMLLNNINVNKTGSQAPVLSFLDPHKDFVTYAFRPPDVDGEHGIWISYDDPRIAAIKALYVRDRRLGGVALFDVSLDDFQGVCNGDIFPMLRYIKYTFL